MHILLITDQSPGSTHSAVEGIFNSHLKDHCKVDLVYFSREQKSPQINGSSFILPHRLKRRGTLQSLQTITDLGRYDAIIVRNLFGALRSVLKIQHHSHCRVGFWESFPHSFRRLYEARITGRAKLRKTIEYAIRRRIENSLLARCNFYFPITETFKQRYRSMLNIPYLPLPMGVDFKDIAPPNSPLNISGPKRFIYIGTIDSLRDVMLIFSAFAATAGDFVLDVFTQSDNEPVRKIRAIGDKRINVHPAQPRTQLLHTLQGYDVGIGLIPPTDLYVVSSPTKTLEYYAAGIPAIINPLPEYGTLFDENSAFICKMTVEEISSTVSRILSMSRAELQQIAHRGREIVKRQRSYAVMAESLYLFLDKQLLHRAETA